MTKLWDLVRRRKWMGRTGLALAAPFFLAIYVHFVARFIDWLSPYRPHTRLLLWAHYIGVALRLIASSPALVAVVVVLALVLFRQAFVNIAQRIESFAIGKLSAKFTTPGQLTPGLPVQNVSPPESAGIP